MSGLPGVRRLFRLVGWHDPIEREIDEELQFHLDAETDLLVARGRSPEEARAEARRRFGDVGRTRARLAQLDRGRRMKERRVSWFQDLGQDLGYAIRGLRRQPGFAVMVTATLALGIGANATMFGLLDRLLLRPPAFVTDPGHVVRFQLTESEPGMGSWTNESMAWKTFVDQRDHATYFSSIAPFFTQDGMPLGRGPEAGKARVTLAAPAFFALLGVHPARGRFFREEEDRLGSAEQVAVLSWRYWQLHYGGRADALGARLALGTGNYEVIGVAPEGFNGVELDAVDLWIPFQAGAPDVVGRSGEWRETYGWQWMKLLARLKPGVTRERAGDEATRVQRAAVAKEPQVDHTATAALVPLTGFERAAVSHARERVALWLTSVALIVLLIICANIANLLLARAGSRRREIAVRLALGVGRTRLIRQLLAESVLLAGLGGLGALLVVRWGGDLLRATLLPDVTWVDSPLDWRVGAVTALATLLTGIMVGLVPALHASRPTLTAALRSGAADAASPRSRLRSTLLGAQAGLSLMLLVGAGLFVRSLVRVTGTDIGYDPRGVVVADLDLGLAGYDRTARADFYDRALERVLALPGSAHASLAISAPFWTMYSKHIQLTDRDSTPRLKQGGPYYNGVTPEYFATVGMRLVRGRGFTAADAPGAQPVMVINETMADAYWKSREPLGQCVKLGGDSVPCARVIGVVANAKVNAIQEEPRAMYYVPLGQSVVTGMSGDRVLFVKARGRAGQLIPELHQLLQGMAPNLPLANVRTFQSQIDPEIQPWRLGAVMFGLFGALALLVAALGLYSIMSYTVVQRTREFGIRTALGASGAQVLRTVLRDGLRVVVSGMVLGAALALVAGRFVAPLLYQTSPRDPLVFAVVGCTLLASSVAAILIPARRATRVDPLEALRSD